jgi:hypothetical protein
MLLKAHLLITNSMVLEGLKKDLRTCHAFLGNKSTDLAYKTH